MKILLTSDWHLGKSLYHQKLLSHQEKFFLQEFISLAKDLKPDLLIIAGDVFDRPVPDKESLFLFEEILKELASSKIRSYIILGNHDSRRTALHKFFLELGGIYIIDDLKVFLNPLKILDESRTEYYLYLLPYLSPYEIEEILTQEGFEFEGIPRFFTGAFLKCLFEQVRILRPAILVGHFAVSGFSPSGEELNVRGLSQDYTLEEELFNDFDFLFLGHLHRPQVRKMKFFYPGAPLPYSFESAHEKRGIFLIEILANEIRHHELIELASPYELKVYEDTFSRIIELPRTDAYLKVILTDREPVYEAFHRLREKFPNLLYLEYRKPVELSTEDTSAFTWDDLSYDSFDLKLDELRLFREFYQYITKREPDEKVMDIFKTQLENFYKNYSLQ